MKKIRAFTFVELLLVMLVLGVVISLTLPIIKNIKDDDDIFRSYMKKANQDVTDALSMIFIKETNFTGFEMFESTNTYDQEIVGHFGDGSNCTKLKNAFNRGLNTVECGDCVLKLKHDGVTRDWTNCKTVGTGAAIRPDNCTAIAFKDASDNDVPLNQPGLVLSGKPIMVFQYDYSDPDNTAVGEVDPDESNNIYGYIYIDMNKDKGPNQYCKDRYKFIIYNDRVAMDTDTTHVGGCGFEL